MPIAMPEIRRDKEDCRSCIAREVDRSTSKDSGVDIVRKRENQWQVIVGD